MKQEVDVIVLQALQEASSLRQSYLGSEHLLLAILKDESLSITQQLNQYGMNYDKVKKDVIALQKLTGEFKNQKECTKAAIRIIENSDSATSLLMSLIKEKNTLAHSLLENYSILMELIVN